MASGSIASKEFEASVVHLVGRNWTPAIYKVRHKNLNVLKRWIKRYAGKKCWTIRKGERVVASWRDRGMRRPVVA